MAAVTAAEAVAPSGAPAPAASASGTRVTPVGIALAASLLSGIGGQLVGANAADIQGGIGASSDEGSFFTTAYIMAQFGGIVCAGPLIAAFGLGRYLTASTMLFAAAALACASAPPPSGLIMLRMVQGFAAGGLGPAGFVAVFMAFGGGARLPAGLTFLAFALLLPVALGPVLSGHLQHALGWEALFLVQAAAAAAIATAAACLLPRAPIAWPALRRDWGAMLLFSLAMAATILVVSQGSRRYWLDSGLIGWSLAASLAAWAGFIFTAWRSPVPVLNVSLLSRRRFVMPIALNFLFRIGLAGVTVVMPLLLAMAASYRPLEIGSLFVWALVPQLLAFPTAFLLLHLADGRLIMAAGLLLLALGMVLAADSSNLIGAEQLRLPMVLAGAGQVFFLVPNIMAGVRSIHPSDGPTISLMFNATSLGGTSIGAGLASELITERQKYHFQALTEAAGANGSQIGRIEELSGALQLGGADEMLSAARTVATIVSALRREAFILSANEAFLVAVAILLAGAFGIMLLDRQPRLSAASGLGPGAAR
ncbi:MAG TPA: MFS transporter [Sphingomicrobium sp.]